MQYQAGQVSNQVAYFSLVSFYFFILSLITFCMKSPLSNNSLFRREQLNSLNSAILNTIYHKKYPLNYHLLKSSHAPNRHYQIRKLSTTPSQPITKPPPCKAKLVQTGGNSSRIRKKSSKLRQSMGQHLHAVRLKQVELSFSQNYYFNEINRKLNTYLRERRKGRCVLTEKNQKQEDLFYEIQHQKPKQQVSFKQSLNLAKLLKNFRKDHLSQILNQTQPNQFDIPSTLNIKHQAPDLKSIDFYQDEQQRWKLARKYPVKAAKMHEDLNKQLIVDMATELKENQYRESEDKYSKMRMMANHKKIISMG